MNEKEILLPDPETTNLALEDGLEHFDDEYTVTAEQEARTRYVLHLAGIGALSLEEAETYRAPTATEAVEDLRRLSETQTDNCLFDIVAAAFAAPAPAHAPAPLAARCGDDYDYVTAGVRVPHGTAFVELHNDTPLRKWRRGDVPSREWRADVVIDEQNGLNRRQLLELANDLRTAAEELDRRNVRAPSVQGAE